MDWAQTASQLAAHHSSAKAGFWLQRAALPAHRGEFMMELPSAACRQHMLHCRGINSDARHTRRGCGSGSCSASL